MTMLNKHHSNKSKAKMRIARLGKKLSDEQRLRKSKKSKEISIIRNLKSGMLGKKHSEETKKKMRESAKRNLHGVALTSKGKNNVNWKGGITSENERIRKSIEYKLWRKAVLERDNFICQKCNQRGGILFSHHINNFADYPELRTSIENGIIFCKNCHQEFHKIYGKKNNTREQLKEFLK